MAAQAGECFCAVVQIPATSKSQEQRCLPKKRLFCWAFGFWLMEVTVERFRLQAKFLGSALLPKVDLAVVVKNDVTGLPW